MPYEQAAAICARLREAGHQAVLAGGCVRDRRLGREPVDFDIATAATPEQIQALFPHTVPVGKRFGVMIVREGERDYEVATFRSDGDYGDGRRPDSVTFSSDREDAARRDFTINALFEDPADGRVIDYVDGQSDLDAGIIRAVGDPGARFAEDHLRLLRAVRFAARFDFEIEADTFKAMREHAPKVAGVSPERIGEELIKMLTEGRARRAFELLDQSGLLAHVLPELLPMKGCEQTPDHHPEGDVWTHTLLCIDKLTTGASPTLALGVLLHDVAKPQTAARSEGRVTFYGHTSIGAEVATTICKRLRRSNAITDRVATLVHQHLRHCSASQMKRSTLKRFLRQDCIGELLELCRIDSLSSSGDLGHYDFCMQALADMPGEKMRPTPLITGRDLIELGMKPGPAFKKILSEVEDAQLEGTIADRDRALELARKLYSDSM